MNEWYRIFEKLTWVFQLGFSLLFAPVCMLALCWWLTTYHGVGMWIYIPGLVVGMLIGFTSFAKFLRYCIREQDREREESASSRSGFNAH